MFEDLFGYPKVLAIFDPLLSAASPFVFAASGHSSLSSAAFSVRLAAQRQFGRLPPQHARTTARRTRFGQTLMMSPIKLWANVLRRHSVPSAPERKRTVGCALRARSTQRTVTQRKYQIPPRSSESCGFFLQRRDRAAVKKPKQESSPNPKRLALSHLLAYSSRRPRFAR
jgi:hypothetical protein